jgi:hypothetical protein
MLFVFKLFYLKKTQEMMCYSVSNALLYTDKGGQSITSSHESGCSGAIFGILSISSSLSSLDASSKDFYG